MRRNEDRQGKRLLHSCSHIRATLVRMKHVRHSLGAISALLLASLLICGCSKPHVSGSIPGIPSFNGLQFSLAPLGYQRNEYFLSGIATSYKPSGPLNDDGKWSVTPANTSPFTTRLVVIRPIDPTKFNGTILVEWLNVTSGGDAAAEWAYTHRELLRQGYAYVAVSAQQVGVEGGPSYFSGSKPLKQIDPARYAKLHLPGDAFSYDIFTQAGHLLRVNPAALLGPLKPQRLIAAGESQSAIFLTTYVNAIDPIAKVFDGFLLHSRFGFASGLNGSLDGSSGRGLPNASPVLIRDDVRVPVLMTVTETDLLSPLSTFLRVRQPDSNRIHTWEIAGTAHADNYVFGLGGTDSGLEPISQLASGFRAIDSIGGHKLDVAINSAPQHHYVEQAALHALNRWLSERVAPPSAPLLDAAPGEIPKLVLDPNGNALGGIRTPWVDVPVATLSGMGQDGPQLLGLVGSTRPFPPAKLHALYPRGSSDYQARFDASLQQAIHSGFLLEADAPEIRALAAASYAQP